MTLALFTLLLALQPATPPSPATGDNESVLITGRLNAGVVDSDSTPDIREAVIFFRPANPVDVPPLPAAAMRMAGKAFSPGVLPVTVGTTVDFPNTDPILHNAFSTSPQAAFDLGFYAAGESREQHFVTPGLIRVYCNVHHGMVGYVMVLDTPFFTQPDAAGNFTLTLPRHVQGTLYIWHPQSAVIQRDYVATANETLDFVAAFTGRRLPRHLNKHGRHYEQGSQRRY